MRNGVLQKILTELNQRSPVPGLACFAPVVEFLQGAGQGQLVTQVRLFSCFTCYFTIFFQCEQVGAELSAAVHQRNSLALHCIEVLLNYAPIISQLPPSYISKDRTSQYKSLLEELVSDFTSAKCESIVHDTHSLFGLGSNEKVQAVFALGHNLQGVINDYTSQYVKVCFHWLIQTMFYFIWCPGC
jgi:hypothetical protein